MSLQIAGLVPLSSVDWPDHLCATVFLQGCPLACVYCHNEALIDPHAEGTIDWSQVTDLLNKRHGLLDGVVLTGGEPLRQHELGPAITEIKNSGFKVGLHTSGAYPKRLQEIVSTIDWVGLDIKGLPEHYPMVAGGQVGHKAWQSLEIALAAKTDLEVRTTVYPTSPVAASFATLARQLRDSGVTTFALQNARTTGTPQAFQQTATTWDQQAWSQQWEKLVEIATSNFDRVSIRT